MSKIGRVGVVIFGVALSITSAGPFAEAGRSTNPNDFVITSMTFQKDSPLYIAGVRYGADDGKFLVRKLWLRNRSSTPIVEYQLGIIETFVNNEAEVHLFAPAAIEGMTPDTVLELGESLPQDTTDDSAIAAVTKGFQIMRLPKQFTGPIAHVAGLRSIFVFVALVKQERKADFTANIVELTNAVKAQVASVHPAEVENLSKPN